MTRDIDRPSSPATGDDSSLRRRGRLRRAAEAVGERVLRPAWRNYIGGVVGLAIAAPFWELDPTVFGPLVQRWYLVFWLGWSITYLSISVVALRGGDMTRVAADAERAPERARPKDFLSGRDAGIPLATLGALLSLWVAVFVLPAASGATALDAQLRMLSIASVVTGWCMVHLSFAQAYALRAVRSGGFAFPGDPPSGYIDFCYLALSVGTTFGTTDVTTTTTQARRLLMVHQVLAFVFNAVILTLAIALVLR
jgi:uncharacterized membrane protein